MLLNPDAAPGGELPEQIRASDDILSAQVIEL